MFFVSWDRRSRYRFFAMTISFLLATKLEAWGNKKYI
jgi:hypothetical protein